MSQFEGELIFSEGDLAQRYSDLAPSGTVDLVVIGCPQASVGEARATAAAVRGRMELGLKISKIVVFGFSQAAIITIYYKPMALLIC